MDLINLLELTLKQKASDLHLSSGIAPILRIDGELQTLNLAPLESEVLFNSFKTVLTHQQIEQLQQQQELDFALELTDASRFRIHLFSQSRGISAAIRCIPSTIIPLTHFDFKNTLEKICTFPHGLVLVTGPTGSGKSSTLAAMLEHINLTRSAHILSIEDPIEYRFQAKKCLIQQREISKHSLNFNTALHAALRQDPDIIFIGELRDAKTIRLALSAAETGHLVFASLHSASACKTVNRIIDAFPTAEKEPIRKLFAESIQAIIAQVLLKKTTGGRVAAHEIMLSTPAIRNLIHENKIAQLYSSLQTNSALGMITLDQCLKSLVQQGTILSEQARTVAHYPENF
ncbi:PilT/PilU family type 4a pilus ATPase [Acinetobacter rudis]|uniref:type IV pilus twitching motility protein PilT n=1 Tax=Acinetobacter rudis TaxID=632955 RepID=UPI00280DF5CC|nr:PilT/PilU family type 4a pilus ATPase [Acinetobacter rudis]MDQ8953763.1 PilT/PilU family type 4a pilus ATPase [Acinetobacter rudis]